MVREVYRMAVRDHGIPPSEFWGMTFVEFLCLYAEPKFRPRGMTNEQMKELMSRFPDG